MPEIKPLADKHKKTKPQKIVTREANTPSIAKVKFRSQPIENLTKDTVKGMLQKYNFYCEEYDWSKEYCNPNGQGFENNFKEEIINGDKVVIAQASGLMWQKSGSDNNMKYKGAKEYIGRLNREQFAGYSDWRLPTLDEAMSLMEPAKNKDGLYIDPLFDKQQRWIWTSDIITGFWGGASSAWVVHFYGGCCYDVDFDSFYVFVRAVR